MSPVPAAKVRQAASQPAVRVVAAGQPASRRSGFR